METKLSNIVNSKETLIKLNGQTLPVKASYWIAKLARAVDKELQEYEDQRLKLVQKYGEETGENRWQVKQENLETFVGELNGLLAEVVELTGVKPLRLETIEGAQLSPVEVNSILWAIEGEE